MTDSTRRVKVAIIGSGNIATDLLIKIVRLSKVLEAAVMVGIDPESDGLARAARLGAATTAKGIEGFLALPEFKDVAIVFDATSAAAHAHHDKVLRAHAKQVIDLTPAAIGPYVVPTVNLEGHIDAPNISMVTCGGQSTVPIVAAVNRIAPVRYAEIVSSISSRSAGPGTRANIDEFTQTTARALEVVGGAQRGKAIIVLNPAEPPLIMRNTVYCLSGEDSKEDSIRVAIEDMVKRVQAFVPGYRLKQTVQFERFGHNAPVRIPEMGQSFSGLKTTVFLEVEGAGHYLPPYAGNLDIMTSAALKTAERLVEPRRSAAE